jgi:hypothetical protein
MLENTHANVQANKEQWKQEIAQGASRAKDQASIARQAMSGDDEPQQSRSRSAPAA